MDRNTAVATWREVCGSDQIMGLPPTGRMLEQFAERIEAITRNACAITCEAHATQMVTENRATAWAACHECADLIRAR